MAKVTELIRKKIIAHHKAGKSQRWLSKHFNLALATINKITKGTDQNLKDTINKGVEYATELSGLNDYELRIVSDAVNDKVRALTFFKQMAIKNQMRADELLDQASSLADIEAHSRITARNKETVLGKNYDLVEQSKDNIQPMQIRIVCDK